jgi:hypothetical protein
MNPWNKSLNLLNKVEQFYKLATNDVNSADTDLYDSILESARNINEDDVRDETLLIAELYKKAIEMNGGYYTVMKTISNFINVMLDEDNLDQEEVEDVMNKTHNDLKARARASGTTSDSPTAIQELQLVKNNYDFGSSGDEYGTTDEGLQDEINELGYDQDFDLTGGVDKETADKKGRGHSVRKAYSPTDYVKKYQNEIERYTDELENTQNTSENAIINNIIPILHKLINNYSTIENLLGDPSFEYDNSKKEQVENLKDNSAELKKEVTKLKTKLKSYFSNKENAELRASLKTAKTAADFALIHEKIKLNELISNKMFMNKGPEIREREQLIAALSEMGKDGPTGKGRNVSPEVLERHRKKIEEASAKKLETTKVYKELAEKESIKRKVVNDNKRTGRTGSGHKRNKYDFESIDLEGLLVHMKEKLATERVVAKQRVTDRLKIEEKTTFKPYLDAIAKAQDKKDRSALLKIVKDLRNAIEIYKNVQPETLRYIKNVRNSKYFYQYKLLVDKLSVILKQEHVMNDELKEKIRQAMFIGNTLREKFETSKDNRNVVAILEKIINHLSGFVAEPIEESAPDTIREPNPMEGN